MFIVRCTTRLFLFFCLITAFPIHAVQKVEELKLDESAVHLDEDALGIPSRDNPLTRDALASDVVGNRPDPPGKATPVKVGMYIFDIFSIDDADQTFTAKIRYTLRWVDPRLADPSATKIRKMNMFDIWNPLIRETNSRSVQKDIQGDFVYVDPDGQVIYVQGFDGTFTVPLVLRDFPLDSHKLFIRLESLYGAEDLNLLIDKKLTGWNHTVSIPDWIVSDGEVTVGTNYRYDQG